MRRFDDQVVQHGCRAPKRHVIEALHPAEYITDQRSIPLGDQHELLLLTNLRREEPPVGLRHVGPRREKALGIKLIMFDHQQSAKPAKRILITGNRGAYEWRRGHEPILQRFGRCATAHSPLALMQQWMECRPTAALLKPTACRNSIHQ